MTTQNQNPPKKPKAKRRKKKKNYYFTQVNTNDAGDYTIEIVDENDFIVQTIAINIPEELSKL